MGKKLVKGGWVYDYDISAEYRRKYDCELTDVRYVLGEQFDTDKRNVLICIGINPSMAMPNFLDPTLRRVQDYAKRSGEYGAWYMLNVYPKERPIRTTWIRTILIAWKSICAILQP